MPFVTRARCELGNGASDNGDQKGPGDDSGDGPGFHVAFYFHKLYDESPAKYIGGGSAATETPKRNSSHFLTSTTSIRNSIT